MFGLKGRPYSAHVLISFSCDSDIKAMIFLHFKISPDISVLFILAIIKIWRFSAFSTKSKMAANILCRSLELEPLPGSVLCLVQRNNLTLDVC